MNQFKEIRHDENDRTLNRMGGNEMFNLAYLSTCFVKSFCRPEDISRDRRGFNKREGVEEDGRSK